MYIRIFFIWGCQTIFKWSVDNEQYAELSCLSENGLYFSKEKCRGDLCGRARNKVVLHTGMIYHCNVTNQPSNMTITDEGLGGMLQIFSTVVPKYQSFILARGMEMYKQFNEKVENHKTVTEAMHFNV